MRKNSTLAILGLSLSLFACGKDDDKNDIVTKYPVHNIASNFCIENDYPYNPSDAELTENSLVRGACPKTLTVATETATIVKTCDPVTVTQEGISITTRSYVYSRMDDGEGNAVEVNAEAATATCTAIKQGIES